MFFIYIIKISRLNIREFSAIFKRNLERRFDERDNIRIRAEIDTSLIGYDRGYYFPQIYLVFRGYTSAGLATRFRTRTHARVIGDNVRENDLCHAVPVELRPRLTSRITNFDRTPIVFVSIIDFNKSAYLLAARNFHQFLSPTWCEVTFIKSSHYMYVRTYIQIYSTILVGAFDLIIEIVSPS